MRSGSETLEKEFEKSDILIVWCLLSSEKITTIIWKVFSFSTLHHFSFSKKKIPLPEKSLILNFKFSKLDSMQNVCNNNSLIKFSFFFFTRVQVRMKFDRANRWIGKERKIEARLGAG